MINYSVDDNGIENDENILIPNNIDETVMRTIFDADNSEVD